MNTEFTCHAKRTLRAANRPLGTPSIPFPRIIFPGKLSASPRPMQVPSLADWTPCVLRPEIREAEAGGPARTPHARFRALMNLTHDCRCSGNSLKISIRQATVLPPGDGGGGGDRRLPVPVARHGSLRVGRPPGRDPAHFASRTSHRRTVSSDSEQSDLAMWYGY